MAKKVSASKPTMGSGILMNKSMGAAYKLFRNLFRMIEFRGYDVEGDLPFSEDMTIDPTDFLQGSPNPKYVPEGCEDILNLFRGEEPVKVSNVDLYFTREDENVLRAFIPLADTMKKSNYVTQRINEAIMLEKEAEEQLGLVPDERIFVAFGKVNATTVTTLNNTFANLLLVSKDTLMACPFDNINTPVYTPVPRDELEDVFHELGITNINNLPSIKSTDPVVVYKGFPKGTLLLVTQTIHNVGLPVPENKDYRSVV